MLHMKTIENNLLGQRKPKFQDGQAALLIGC